ncbi:MAG TPA: glycosyltransferase family 39 protein [Terriglobales bacterium]
MRRSLMHRPTMVTRPAIPSDLKIKSRPASSAWAQQVLLFALFFVCLMLLHAPLLRFPYFWDEAGYYVPVARDLFLTGSPIPLLQSTLSNAHPPLVMAWLALAWRVFGYSTLVTRTAMLVLSAFSLLGLFRLARSAANLPVAWATTALVSIYPVYFTQSSMALVDLPAAGLTFWALAAYIEDRPRKLALWCSLAALAKETAILAPLAMFGWELLAHFARPRLKETRWPEILPPVDRRTHRLYLLISVVPVAVWYAYHYSKTGFLLGNPEFFRYNVAATLNPFRVPLALGMRLWQLFGYFGLYLLTLAGLLAMLRPPQIEKAEKTDRKTENAAARPRIPIWMQAAFLSVTLAYLAFMSAVGGAVLARYMLPVVPLVMLLWISTLWRRVRHWKLIVGAVAIAFVAGLFTNPPYGFSLEDNLAYRDYIVMHAETSRFLAMRYSGARVLTAWPASDELTRPWLGYVSQPIRVVRIEDFSAAQIDVAVKARDYFDVALVFSTKYQPPHVLFENWDAWQRIKEKFFGYHRDLPPEDIAQRLGGTITYSKEENGQWSAVIAIER